MMLDFLTVILMRPRFPENIGMAARACANMGCPHIILVQPERWIRAKAEPLATPKGMPILDNLQLAESLEEALAPFAWSVATTARLGGCRRAVLHPEQAAANLWSFREQKAALVLGPEDRGLSNEEIGLCHAIAHIPTSGASSLNLAQAALVMLYEFHKAAKKGTETKKESRTVSHAQALLLENTLKDVLLGLDCLPQENPDYFFGKWRQILRRAPLKQHEFDCWMGFCRQIKNKIQQ